MSSIQLGTALPNLTVATTQNEALELESYQGKNLVMFFYPKDNTPGCTQEGKDFSEAYEQFKALNTEIVGVSRESIKSHNNFINKFSFPFDLISDPDEVLCKTMDVIKEKNMYGRKYMGIERSTFIFDANGVLQKEFRKVKVKTHIAEVLEAVQAM
ncbi:MAG: peroxiredoxin [Arenicella sp.]